MRNKTTILMVFASIIIALLGLNAGLEIDNTLKQDQRVISMPIDDSDEAAYGMQSNRLDSVHYLYTKGNFAYTMEYTKGDSEMIAIPIDIFPKWDLADSLEGYKTRGTDTWISVASMRM